MEFSTDQIIALLACLLTLFVALATFLTVRQIGKQREASYKPELVFSKSRYTANSTKNSMHWNCATRTENKIVDSLVPFTNIGLGAAKEVSIEWEFDVPKAVTLVNELAQKAMSEGYIEIENDTVLFKSNQSGNAVHIWTTQKHCSLDYILSGSEEVRSQSISIPIVYLTLFASFSASKFKIDQKDNDKFVELQAVITYRDIAEKSYSVAYKFTPEVAMFQSGSADEKSEQLLEFYLVPKKIRQQQFSLLVSRLLKDAIFEALRSNSRLFIR